MATSKGFKQFAKRMGFYAKEVTKNTERAVKRAAIAADQTLVLKTPVDTGRARGNWIVSVGAPDLQERDVEGAAAAQEALNQGLGTIGSWRLNLGPIFIANSVPYIVRLDKGWSAQAPAGMTSFAIQAAAAQLSKVKLLPRR